MSVATWATFSDRRATNSKAVMAAVVVAKKKCAHSLLNLNHAKRCISASVRHTEASIEKEIVIQLIGRWVGRVLQNAVPQSNRQRHDSLLAFSEPYWITGSRSAVAALPFFMD